MNQANRKCRKKKCLIVFSYRGGNESLEQNRLVTTISCELMNLPGVSSSGWWSWCNEWWVMFSWHTFGSLYTNRASFECCSIFCVSLLTMCKFIMFTICPFFKHDNAPCQLNVGVRLFSRDVSPSWLDVGTPQHLYFFPQTQVSHLSRCFNTAARM